MCALWNWTKDWISFTALFCRNYFGGVWLMLQFLYNQSISLVCIASSEWNMLPVTVGIWQGCTLSWFCFNFLWLEYRLNYGPHMLRGLGTMGFHLFADAFVWLASSSQDFLQAFGEFPAGCEASGIRVPSILRPQFLTREKHFALSAWVRSETTLALGGRVQASWGLVHNWGRIGVWDWQADHWSFSYYAVTLPAHCGEERGGPESKALNLSVDLHSKSHLCSWALDHDQRTVSKIQAAIMAFLLRVARHSFRDRVRISVTRRELGISADPSHQ